MFVDPLVLALEAGNISLAITPHTSANSVRKGITSSGSHPFVLTLGQAPSRENPAAGGSVRHLIRSDIPVADAEGKNLGTVSALTIIVRPNNGIDVDVKAKIALQANVSFLLGETESLDVAATIDATTLTRFLNGEG